jgi:hypothetical protein
VNQILTGRDFLYILKKKIKFPSQDLHLVFSCSFGLFLFYFFTEQISWIPSPMLLNCLFFFNSWIPNPYSFRSRHTFVGSHRRTCLQIGHLIFINAIRKKCMDYKVTCMNCISDFRFFF